MNTPGKYPEDVNMTPLATRVTPFATRIGDTMPLWWLWWWPDSHKSQVPAPEKLVLKDGTKAWIRPILKSDRQMHAEGYEHLSPESKYKRFLSPVPHLSEQLLDRLVDQVDGVDHVAYYLFLDDQESHLPVSIGRIVRDPEHHEVADIAVTVQDAYQGRGIATAMLQALLAHRPKGVKRLLTVVSTDNHASLAMLKRLGPNQVTLLSSGVLEVRVNLEGDDTECLTDLPSQDPPAEWRRDLRTRDLICPWLH